MNLFQGRLGRLLSGLEALLDRWVGIEFLGDLDLEADWLRGCVLVLAHVCFG